MHTPISDYQLRLVYVCCSISQTRGFPLRASMHMRVHATLTCAQWMTIPPCPLAVAAFSPRRFPPQKSKKMVLPYVLILVPVVLAGLGWVCLAQIYSSAAYDRVEEWVFANPACNEQTKGFVFVEVGQHTCRSPLGRYRYRLAEAGVVCSSCGQKITVI